MAAGRRAGYDATFNAPKSLSIQAFVGGDARLVAAHEAAVTEGPARTGNLRLSSRRSRHQQTLCDERSDRRRGLPPRRKPCPDPHLHSHAFVFNVVRGDSSSRLLASNPRISSNAPGISPRSTATPRPRSAKLGYAIERREHGFELLEYPRNLLERFSKRARRSATPPSPPVKRHSAANSPATKSPSSSARTRRPNNMSSRPTMCGDVSSRSSERRGTAATPRAAKKTAKPSRGPRGRSPSPSTGRRPRV